ncbi:uracil-DNA glycosylase [Crocinitomix catalasitica]|uniref:uracil-DNA glycosylase n=1 Tax=Crocinitomix catalasitica TaxID=184607 RepID=UPI0004800EA1|nr:uracil-DNA glycosylase [Crocinitomix catalasitica]
MAIFKQLSQSWQIKLSHVLSTEEILSLDRRVTDLYQSEHVLPVKENLFRAFDLCSFEDVKIVIIGQDPYPTPGHADGLCFSVPENIKPLAKSLKNILKEIQSDIGETSLTSGSLKSWAKQGILLLNTTLTVKAGETNAHSKIGWQKFTDEVIKKIAKEKEEIVFLLWGSKAMLKSDLIDSTKHFILTAPHPSPLSAYRGFFGCKHFSETNTILARLGKKTINW